MGDVGGSGRRTGRSGQSHAGSDNASARQFGYEMAFDPRFEGRPWGEVEAELRSVYADWIKTHDPEGGSQAWDEARGAIRDAWEGTLEVERTQVDPRTGQWEEVAPEYRRLWEEQRVPGATWDEVEPGYHYAADMGLDPRYQGRPWGDVAPFFEAGLPGWAASHGYQVREEESVWDRLRESVRHAWERARHPRR